MKLKSLVGSGEQIGLVTLPVLVACVALYVWRPALFEAGGPSDPVRVASAVVLALGVVVWLWSVVLILTQVPKRRLITGGPYAVVKHPLYTAVGLLVVPAAGLLMNTWLGFVVGLTVYLASRVFSPREEDQLARTFGPAWDEYSRRVALPWL